MLPIAAKAGHFITKPDLKFKSFFHFHIADLSSAATIASSSAVIVLNFVFIIF